jgi:hypothetical protein
VLANPILVENDDGTTFFLTNFVAVFELKPNNQGISIAFVDMSVWA